MGFTSCASTQCQFFEAFGICTTTIPIKCGSYSKACLTCDETGDNNFICPSPGGTLEYACTNDCTLITVLSGSTSIISLNNPSDTSW